MADTHDPEPGDAGAPWTASDPLACPVCQQPSDSIKRYEYVHRMVFYLVGATWQTACYQSCPKCMRRVLGRSMLVNLVLANLLWPVVAVWSLTLYGLTYTRGHSRAIVKWVLAQQEDRDEYDLPASSRAKRQSRRE